MVQDGHLRASITIFCVAHGDGPQDPIVTLQGREWAYCRGGLIAAGQTHEWLHIEATSVADLRSEHWQQPHAVGT